MRIHHALYSILLSLPFLTLSCGGNGERMDMLQQADSLIADRPDSAGAQQSDKVKELLDNRTNLGVGYEF